jgi:hypothetical protein
MHYVHTTRMHGCEVFIQGKRDFGDKAYMCIAFAVDGNVCSTLCESEACEAKEGRCCHHLFVVVCMELR